MKTDWVKKYIDDFIETSGGRELRNEKLQYVNMPLYKYCGVVENEKRLRETIDFEIANFEADQCFFQNPVKFNDPFDCFMGFSVSRVLKDWIETELKHRKLLNAETRKKINDFFADERNTQMTFEQNEQYVTSVLGGEMGKLLIDAKNDILGVKQKLNSQGKTLLTINREFVSDNFRVTCLSEKMDSPLMWSHYANKHYGFCLEYDFSSEEYDDRLPEFVKAQLMLFPVIYSKKRPLISQTLYRARVKAANGGIKNIETETKRRILADIMMGLLYKSDDWKYEREWRILRRKDGKKSVDFPPAKKVFLGVNMEDEAKSRIIKAAKKKKIPVFQMYMTMDRYEFGYYEI